MTVYFIQAGEHGPVKIGFTDDVRRRFAKMQSDNHDWLTIIRIVDGDRSIERAFQRLFLKHHIRGDWFAFDHDMFEGVPPNTVVRDEPIEVIRRLNVQAHPADGALVSHANLIRDLGGKVRVAEALGLDRDVLTKWHVRGIPSKYWHRVIELGAGCEPPLVFTAADLERTKPDTSSTREAA